MAWPNTPLTSYSANTTPVIHAGDLNSIQDAINRIVVATYSLKAVVVDGTGGSVVAPVAGTVKVSATASATALPTATAAAGITYKDAIIVGWCSEDRNNAGGLIGANSRYYNVQSAGRNAVGDYTIVFNFVPSDAANCQIQITPSTTGFGVPGGSIVDIVLIDADGSGRLRVNFVIKTWSGGVLTARDCSYRVMAMGY